MKAKKSTVPRQSKKVLTQHLKQKIIYGGYVRIARIHIENFRGIKLADIHFAGTTVLLGDNNTGKSTVFEAIELAMRS